MTDVSGLGPFSPAWGSGPQNDQGYYQSVASQAAATYHVPQNLFAWQIGQESGWNPAAQNGAATGIAQFMPTTAAAYGIDPTDPVQSLYGAAKYDADLYAQTGSWGSVLQKYGTVSSSVPSSVITAANAQLAQLGESPITPATTATAAAPSGPSVTLPGLGKVSISIPTFSFGRITSILLGLIFIAGGIYLFKSVQTVVNRTVQQGVTAGTKLAGKALATVPA